MNIPLTGIYFVGTMFALGAVFLLGTVGALVLEFVERARAKGARPRREWGHHAAAVGIMGAACFLLPFVNPFSREALEWLDERPWVLVPGAVVVWWGLSRALRWAAARRAEEERSADRQRRSSGNTNAP